MVTASEWCRAEAEFWRTLLPFCGRRMTLPDPDYKLPSWAVDMYSDAAGGSTMGPGWPGVGCVIYPSWWTYAFWGDAINRGKTYIDGKKLSNKMYVLELLGPLVGLCGASGIVKCKQVVCWVDNSGSVAIYDKGWFTSCMLCTTLVLAISQVAAALQCQLEVRKITRCSTIQAEAADALSKAAFRTFRHLMPKSTPAPSCPWLC